jgi:hypothetical protein
MANNIQIVGNITNIKQLSRYEDNDARLLNASTIQEDFGSANDYIEYFIYDAGGNLLYSNYEYKSIKIPTTSFINVNETLPAIEIDPVADLKSLGYRSGEFTTQYSFFTHKISSPPTSSTLTFPLNQPVNPEGLFLKEISADRTELRIASTILTNDQIATSSLAIINEYSSSAYFTEYIANFGENKQFTIVNTALNKIESGYEILLKLYKPLSLDIVVNILSCSILPI